MMVRRIVLAAFSASMMASIGCQKPHVATESSYDPCKYSGNSHLERACVITFFQVLSDPSHFDGKRLTMMAWASPAGNALLLFPTKDSLESAETVASIVVYSRPEESNEVGPRYIRVSGIFRLNRGPSGKTRLNTIDVDRLGVLEGAKEL